MQNSKKFEIFIQRNYPEYLGMFSVVDDYIKFLDYLNEVESDEEFINSEYYYLDTNINKIEIGRRLKKKSKLSKLSVDPASKFYIYFSKIVNNELYVEFVETEYGPPGNWSMRGLVYTFYFQFDENNNLIKVDGCGIFEN